MPYAPETYRWDASGTSKIGDTDQLLALFNFPVLYDLGDMLDRFFERPGKRGRKSYDRTALLVILVATRIYGSVPETLRALPEVWHKIRKIFTDMTETEDAPGRHLPSRIPDRHAMQYFKNSLVRTEGVMESLQEEFRIQSVILAQCLGNLEPGATPDWARPDERNTIYGDGTWVKPYSEVFEVADPFTGELVPVGSRAADVATARLQSIFSEGTEDGKKHLRGVNFVAMHTWTKKGRVVLGTATALKAEQWAALEIIDAIADIAADGVHNVVYDRALTGWHADYLMAKHRIQVFGKAVASGGRDERGTRASLAREEVKERAEHLRVECAAPNDIARRRMLRSRVLRTMRANGDPIPLGTTFVDDPEMGGEAPKASTVHLISQGASHTLADGTICTHPIAVDAGALFETTDRHDGVTVKVHHLPCIAAIPRRDGNRWVVDQEFEVLCRHGAFSYHRTWKPTTLKYERGQSHKIDDRIGTDLRPLTEQDGQKFDRVIGRRNDSESYNAWFKRTLHHTGRAMSEELGGQELDFLTAAIRNNSQTWHRAGLDY